jgi:hypothetical protein
MSESLQADGNGHFSAKDFEGSINSYNEALVCCDLVIRKDHLGNLLPVEFGGADAAATEDGHAELDARLAIAIGCLSSLAACQLKLEQWEAVMETCQTVVHLAGPAIDKGPRPRRPLAAAAAATAMSKVGHRRGTALLRVGLARDWRERGAIIAEARTSLEGAASVTIGDAALSRVPIGLLPGDGQARAVLAEAIQAEESLRGKAAASAAAGPSIPADWRGPIVQKGVAAHTGAMLFLGSASRGEGGDGRRHHSNGAGPLSQQLLAVSERFLARFRTTFARRELDVACLEENVRLNRVGVLAAGVTPGMTLFSAIRFIVTELDSASLERIIETAQSRAMLEGIQHCNIATLLRDRMPQFEEPTKIHDAVDLLVHLVNLRAHCNIFLYSVSDDAVFCAQDSFSPPIGTQTLNDVARLTKFAGNPEFHPTDSSSLCQREYCFFCRASGLNTCTALSICNGCKSVSYCCTRCQEADWNGFHKYECGKIKRGEATARGLGLGLDRHSFLNQPGVSRPSVAFAMDGAGVYSTHQLLSYVGGVDAEAVGAAAGEVRKTGGEVCTPFGLRIEY